MGFSSCVKFHWRPVLSEVCFGHHCVAVRYPLFNFGSQVLCWRVLSCLQLSFPRFCHFQGFVDSIMSDARRRWACISSLLLFPILGSKSELALHVDAEVHAGFASLLNCDSKEWSKQVFWDSGFNANSFQEVAKLV